MNRKDFVPKDSEIGLYVKVKFLLNYQEHEVGSFVNHFLLFPFVNLLVTHKFVGKYYII